MSRRQVGFRQSRRAPGGGIPLSVTPSLGDTAAGTRVTITGAGFAGGATVTIGGTACTGVTVVSPTQIECTAPAKAAGTYDVVVTVGALVQTAASAYEAWDPGVIGAAVRYYDSESGVTQVANAISQWNDRGAGLKNATQATAGAKPTYVANRFGYLNHAHALSFDGARTLAISAKEALTNGASIFFVGKATSSASAATQYNPGLTVVGDTSGSSYANGPGFQAGQLSTVNYVEAAGPWTRYSFGTARNDGTPRLYGIIHQTNGTLRGYVNASQEGTDQSSARNATFPGWDNIGIGFTSTDGFNGELASVVVYNGAMSDADRAKLYRWSYARFLRGATSFAVQTSAAAYSTSRDGAALVALGNKLFLIGGWNPGAFPGGVDTTNEVWESSDQGATWTQTLAYDASPATSGAGARFRRRHSFAYCVHTYNGTPYIYVFGGDQIDTDGGNYWRDVWRSADGVTWERMVYQANWSSRVLHMAWSFNGKLYVAGGQTDINTAATALSDVWESSDGGATWTQTTASAGWAARGMVYAPFVFNNKLWICGGGRYDAVLGSRVYYNDVWSWDGTTWVQVTAAAPWTARQYVSTATFGGRMWVINGYTSGTGNTSECWSSTDGSTWYQQTITPWLATHAAALSATPDGSGLTYCCGIETAANVYKVSVL